MSSSQKMGFSSPPGSTAAKASSSLAEVLPSSDLLQIPGSKKAFGTDIIPSSQKPAFCIFRTKIKTGATSLWGLPPSLFSPYGAALCYQAGSWHILPSPSCSLGSLRLSENFFASFEEWGKAEWSSRAGKAAQGMLCPLPPRSPQTSSLCPVPRISLPQAFCNNSSAGLRSWEAPFCHFMSVKSGQGSSELSFHNSLKIPTSLSWGCGPEPPRCCCQLNGSRSKKLKQRGKTAKYCKKQIFLPLSVPVGEGQPGVGLHPCLWDHGIHPNPSTVVHTGLLLPQVLLYLFLPCNSLL